MSPLVAYVLVVAVVIGFGIAAILVPVVGRRACHMCGNRVPITSRRCRRCGYEFTEQVMRQR